MCYPVGLGKLSFTPITDLLYEDAQEIIEGGDGPFKKEITQINKLAQQCRKQRLSNGALNVKSNEVRFRLDEKGSLLKRYLRFLKKLISSLKNLCY